MIAIPDLFSVLSVPQCAVRPTKENEALDAGIQYRICDEVTFELTWQGTDSFP